MDYRALQAPVWTTSSIFSSKIAIRRNWHFVEKAFIETGILSKKFSWRIPQKNFKARFFSSISSLQGTFLVGRKIIIWIIFWTKLSSWFEMFLKKVNILCSAEKPDLSFALMIEGCLNGKKRKANDQFVPGKALIWNVGLEIQGSIPGRSRFKVHLGKQ